MSQQLNPNTPVLVGIGVAQQRLDDPAEGREAYQLMVEAIRTMAADAGLTSFTEVDAIYVPEGIWDYSDPGRLVAQEIGADNAKTVMGKVGILQQSLVSDACNKIASGEMRMAIVTGGEAKYRNLRGTITGVEVTETAQENVLADVVLEPESEIWSEIEAAAGLAMPVGFYALMESSLRYTQSLGLDEHRDELAALYESFSRVAVDNEHAWNRELTTAEQIRNAVGKNKMLAFPYTKLHNSQWNVDQAAGLLLTSLEVAERIGVPREKWVFPLSSTESNYMVNVSQREQLHSCPGARIAGNKSLELAGLDLEDIDYFEMYSCFPAAVRIYAHEMGIDTEKPLTVTGGMTFGGGPLNNYVLQSICKMAEVLRANPGDKGFVSSVSGMLTKQGFSIWSTEPGENGFGFADVTPEVKAQQGILNLQPGFDGKVKVVASTVMYQGDVASRVIAVCDLPNGDRTSVFSEDRAIIEMFLSRETCGSEVMLKGNCLVECL